MIPIDTHVLLAVDSFTQEHLDRIQQTLRGWATWEVVPEQASKAEFAAALNRSDIAVGWPPADLVYHAERVQLLQCGSVGYDAYLGFDWSSKPNFTFCNARGVMSIAVAEQTLAMMLALTRRIPRHVRDQAVHQWQRAESYDEMNGAIACIVGLGDIGMEIAKRCQALGMHVLGVRRNAAAGCEYADRVYPLSQLHQALAEADHVIVIVPGGRDTLHLIGRKAFASMKAGAYFYNVARGSVVDEEALVENLQSGRLAGAGLDVFATEPLPGHHPLWSIDNALILPHSGGRSVREFDRFCDLVIENLLHYKQGEPYRNVIGLTR